MLAACRSGLQQVVEVVQALAELPDGQPHAQLLGQLQPHLQGLRWREYRPTCPLPPRQGPPPPAAPALHAPSVSDRKRRASHRGFCKRADPWSAAASAPPGPTPPAQGSGLCPSSGRAGLRAEAGPAPTGPQPRPSPTLTSCTRRSALQPGCPTPPEAGGPSASGCTWGRCAVGVGPYPAHPDGWGAAFAITAGQG